MKDKFAKRKKARIGNVNKKDLAKAKTDIENLLKIYARLYPEAEFCSSEKGNDEFEIYASAEVHDEAGVAKLTTDFNKAKWKYLQTTERELDAMEIEKLKGEHNGIVQIECLLESNFDKAILHPYSLLSAIAEQTPVKKLKKTVLVFGRYIQYDRRNIAEEEQ